MPVIAVINRKGGSGKSTVSAHLAAWCAHNGHAVMLGDVDRQQSSRSWLRRRSAELPFISPWNVDQNILRVPSGITHAILDTPGGLHGFDLARLVMTADAILMPVCSSSFDRESAAACYAELKALPRVISGRCKVASIGMRIDTRTRNSDVLQAWADAQGVPYLGALRETQLYVQCLENGMTVFDLPEQRAIIDRLQWEPILEWLGPCLNPSVVPKTRQATTKVSSTTASPNPAKPSVLPSLASNKSAIAPVVKEPVKPRLTVMPDRKIAVNQYPLPRHAAAEKPLNIPRFLKLVKF
jgi:chromosome partitioning protein